MVSFFRRTKKILFFDFVLLNYLIYLDSTNQMIVKTSIGKERNEKRNSTGSAILSSVSFFRN